MSAKGFDVYGNIADHPYFCIAYKQSICHGTGMTRFTWDPEKDRLNQVKHGVAFRLAQHAFADPNRVIAQDANHSREEDRFFCIGKVAGGILTVRFTYRNDVIRIFGAGYWRKGKQFYEKQNQIHG